MKKILFNSLLLIAALFSVPALTAPTISLNPHPQKVHLGENNFIDVNVSGLQSGTTNMLLAAFSTDVLLDSALFQFLPGLPSFDSRLGAVNLGETLFGDSTSSAGILNLYELSLLEDSVDNCILCLGPYLEYLQSDSFTLATLEFYMQYNADISSVKTTFSTANAILSDPFGNEITAFSNPSVVVTVDGSRTPLLIIVGLFLIFGKNYNYRSAKICIWQWLLTRNSQHIRNSILIDVWYIKYAIGFGLLMTISPAPADTCPASPISTMNDLVHAIYSANTTNNCVITLQKGDYVISDYCS